MNSFINIEIFYIKFTVFCISSDTDFLTNIKIKNTEYYTSLRGTKCGTKKNNKPVFENNIQKQTLLNFPFAKTILPKSLPPNCIVSYILPGIDSIH